MQYQTKHNSNQVKNNDIALNKINLKIKRGEKIAIVGRYLLIIKLFYIKI